MKFSRQQIEDQNLTVWEWPTLQHARGRRFVLPEEVDTDTGTISFWTVPSEDKETLLAERKFTADSTLQPPTELDLVLQVVTGLSLSVLDADQKTVAETKPADETKDQSTLDPQEGS